MGQPISIAALPATGGTHRSVQNPESAPDSALFALLMAEAGGPFPGGFVAEGAPEANVEAPIPAGEGFEGSLEGAFESEAEANHGGVFVDERLRPSMDAAAARPGTARPASFERPTVQLPATVGDDISPTGDVLADPPAQNGPERGTRLAAPNGPADPGALAGPLAGAVRPSNASSDPGSAPRTMKLSDLDLETFGVQRIEVQVEHVSRNLSGTNASVETPPKGDSIERAMLRPVDAPAEPKGQAVPAEAHSQETARFRTLEAGRPGSVADVLDDATPPGGFDSGNGESAGGRATSETEWDAVFAARTARPGRSEPEVAVESGADLPDAPPDTARPSGDFRGESREAGSTGSDRRVLAPQPPKSLDLPTPNPEPVRRVLMMVGDGENEIRVLVRESDGDVSVRFDAPHAIRAHLEASAHRLAESMIREHVSLVGMTFSGPSDGNDPRSNPPHVMRSERSKVVSSGPADDTAALDPGLEFAGHGSRVRIRV